MMDKEEFLTSGLLEQYVLGLTSEEETRLVEHFLENYPEIRAKLNVLQEAIEQYAAQYTVSPPRRLKRRILSETQAEDDDSTLENAPDAPYISKRPLAANASTITKTRTLFVSFFSVVLIALVLIGILLRRQQQLQADKEILLGALADYRMQNSILQKEQTLFKNIFNFIENGDACIVHLQGQGVSKDTHAVVYWNSNTQESYIKLIKMPALPDGKQFQLWADVNGTMINAGLLEENSHHLQTIQYIPMAASLNITMEPLGGSEHPSVLLLVASGALVQNVN